MTRRYELMLAERADFPLTMMAEMLGASRSGCCSWVPNGCPVDDWSGVREAVRRVRSESNRTFGHRFVHSFMPDEHAGVTLYRAPKCMRELGIKGCTPCKSKGATVPDKGAKPKPDLVRRDFTSPVPACKLVGGITCLRTGQGRLYLAAAIDLNARMVAGWSLSDRMAAGIAVSALETARRRGYVAENAIFHSDSKNVISRFLRQRRRCRILQSGPRRSILTRTPIDGRPASAA